MEKVRDNGRTSFTDASGMCRAAIAATAAAFLLTGCVRDHSRTVAGEGDYGGTMVVSTGADADVLLPVLTQSVQGAQVSQLMFELLAMPPEDLSTFGDDGFTPALAERWTWSDDSLSIAFHLSPNARWHDGTPVRAHDVAFTHALYTNPGTGSHTAPLLRGIDSVTVADSLTAVFWYGRRHLEQFFQAAYLMRIHPRHLMDTIPVARLRSSDIARRPVGSGPFRFAAWIPGSSMEVVADSAHHRGRPHLDRIIWTVAPDPSTLSARLFSGEADFLEMLRAEMMGEFARNANVRAVPFPSLFQSFVLFNVRDPRNRQSAHAIFGDREVRRALSMAIDRAVLVANTFDSLGRVGIGPINRVMAGADTSLGHLEYDLQRSRRLLDSLGWVVRPDGFRQKGGRQLRFSLMVPTSSAPRMRMAVLLQEMMRQVGARMEVEQMEFTTFASRQSARRFDAAIGFWALDPSPSSIRQVWGTEAADAEGGANYGGYRSVAFDALVDSATSTLSPAQARAYLRRAYEVLLQDAPAVFVVETVNYVGIHRRIVPGALRADGWWHTAHEWSVPAPQRIARDAVTTAAAQ
jgi:peptide/nickel transport system substrate-binding protein